MKALRIALVALALVAGVPLLPAAQAPEKVVFALNWFAVGDHAAYWVALDRGYYRARGLDVELQNSKGSGDSLAKVDTNRADVGLADAAVVIPRIAQGARVKIVGAVFDHSPLNFWMWTSSGITRPKDLEGKTLAAPPGDAQRQHFAAADTEGDVAQRLDRAGLGPVGHADPVEDDHFLGGSTFVRKSLVKTSSQPTLRGMSGM